MVLASTYLPAPEMIDFVENNRQEQHWLVLTSGISMLIYYRIVSKNGISKYPREPMPERNAKQAACPGKWSSPSISETTGLHCDDGTSRKNVSLGISTLSMPLRLTCSSSSTLVALPTTARGRPVAQEALIVGILVFSRNGIHRRKEPW